MPETAVLWSHDEPNHPIGDRIDRPMFVQASDGWQIDTLTWNTINNSNVTFIVPDGEEYQIFSVYVLYASSATVGNRQLVLRALDDSDSPIAAIRTGVVQTASQTRTYQFGPGLAQDAAFRDTDYASVAMMPIVLKAGQKLQIYDRAAIAATEDDLVIQVQIARRNAA